MVPKIIFMSETSSKDNSYGWLETTYGVKFKDLDEETQDLVSGIGQTGVEDLIRADKKEHRGTSDLVSLAERLQRIEETGGLERWVSNGARMIEDKPKDWVVREELEIGEKIFDEEE